MAQTKCPGQNWMFWTPGDIFEVTCANCGTEVEFFKDDATRRCPGCGQVVRNPKLNLGCAQWCEHAKECLGYDPKELELPEGDAAPLVERLLGALKSELSSQGFAEAVARLEHAKTLMRAEGGQPRLLLPAALVASLSAQEAAQLLKDQGLDGQSVEDVLELLEAEPQSLEARILADATTLARVSQGETEAAQAQALTPSGKFLLSQLAARASESG